MAISNLKFSIRNAAHIVLYSWFICLLSSCHSNKTEEETAQFYISGDTITITANSPLTGKIKIETLQPSPHRLQMFTTGIVKSIPTQYAEISSPFAGRITKSYLKLGMKCTPGTPLFEITSPDFISAQKNFFQGKSQIQKAEKALKRQQDLTGNEVGTQKDLEEAQTAYEVEKKEYENAVIGIKIFKADPDNLSLGQALVVRSPIAGEVIEDKVVLGQYLKEDAASIATVAELSKIWIVAQIKEKDIRFIHELDACNIDVTALPEKKIKGKVYHVNEIVNEDTRSVEVIIEANNAGHTLKPGMYVTVNFVAAPVDAILIPSKALLQMNDASFVYIETAAGKYIKRKVETGNTEGERVVIKSGLNTGDKIISEGGFYLSDVK